MLCDEGALCNVLWAHGVLQTLTPELFDKVCYILEAKPLADFKPHVSAQHAGANTFAVVECCYTWLSAQS